MSFVSCASGPRCRNVIERLPNLKLIASTGTVNGSIDVAAAGDHGIAVVHTGYRSDTTIEFTWALILASARHIVTESNSDRKSTRLNSSHGYISYAVFCLKKKKKQ